MSGIENARARASETSPPPPTTTNPARSPVLEVRDADVTFPVRGGSFRAKDKVHALTGANLSVAPGEAVGIVGESGCGKSTLARVLVGLHKPTAGTVLFRGEPVWSMRASARRRTIGTGVGMVFQDPATALNRRLPVHKILRDPLDVHGRGGAADRQARVRELMDLVGLPRSAAEALPAELSGGQRQRVAIARALALEPELLVADEPTSALDVSVRAQILNLLMDLKDSLGVALVVVSHDIQTLRWLSDRIITMYLGRIVEQTPAGRLADTRHPYTRTLLSAMPSLLARTEPILLTGPVPSAVHPPSGCPFRGRCWRADDRCAESMPEPRSLAASASASASDVDADAAGSGAEPMTEHVFRCHHPVLEPADLPSAPPLEVS